MVIEGRNTGKKADDEKGTVNLHMLKGTLPSPTSSMSPLATQLIEERMVEIALGRQGVVGVMSCTFISVTT